MKLTHRPDLFCWSRFDEARNIDFHSWVWVREAGNIAIDPLPLSEHDRAHLRDVGGLSSVVVTNSDHLRDAENVAATFAAEIIGPKYEKETFGLDCDRWVGEGDQIALGLTVIEMDGSKTPGELALILDHTTLITGDLIRSHAGGSLTMLPAGKLRDPAAARASVKRLLGYPDIDAVLCGDGWPVFRDGRARLVELVDSFG